MIETHETADAAVGLPETILRDDAARLIVERMEVAEAIVDVWATGVADFAAIAPRADAAGMRALLADQGARLAGLLKAALVIPPADLRAAIARARATSSQEIVHARPDQ